MRGKAPMARPFVLAVFLVLAAGQASALAGSPEDLVGLPAWDRVPTPNGSGSSGELHGVQAFSATNVWVVGHTGTSTLTERWNGSSFSVVPSPSIANRSSILEDVDGVAPNDLWTVGHADVTSFVGSRSLALHWNGSSWTRIATPSVGKSTAFNDLTGVAAVASNDVWAVGTFQGGTGGNTFHALIQHWNGTAWSLVRNDCGRGLNKVDARSATDIWAVGGSDTCHWNGSSWTRFPVGPPPNQQGFVNLSDVTVIGATNAWAVGDQATSCGEGQVCHSGEIQQWNGTAWIHMTNFEQIGYGVDAVAADDIWSVGPGPNVLHFDGQQWSEVPQGVQGGELWSVEASGPDDIWAAGDVLGPTRSTLVEHAPSATSGAVVGQTNVSFAVVSWFGPETGSVETDSLGDYQVGGLTAGRYLFTVQEQGCQPDSAEVTVTAGDTIRQDLQVTC